jgi:hypothetical protein
MVFSPPSVETTNTKNSMNYEALATAIAKTILLILVAPSVIVIMFT